MSGKFQKDSRYHNGLLRITVDPTWMMITKFSGRHPIASLVMTTDQAREVVSLLREALTSIDAQSHHEEVQA